MRAEGVLRLMLNISLYVGMTLIEDGKHVRSTVFEDGERRLVTFRVCPLIFLHHTLLLLRRLRQAIAQSGLVIMLPCRHWHLVALASLVLTL